MYHTRARFLIFACSAGATYAESLQQAAKESDAKTSSLPSLPDVGKVLFGGDKAAQQEAKSSDQKTSGLPSLPQVGKAAFGSGGSVDQAADVSFWPLVAVK